MQAPLVLAYFSNGCRTYFAKTSENQPSKEKKGYKKDTLTKADEHGTLAENE